MENKAFAVDTPQIVRRGTKSEVQDDTELHIEPSKSMSLKPEVGMVGGISLIVGTMIGSGIFASASGVFSLSNSAGMGLVVWGLCGVISMLGALCYCELGTMITKSGGEYVYLKEAFGPPLAFLFAYTSTILLKPSQLSIIALAFGQYTIEPFFPSCSSVDPDRVDLKILVKILAAFCIGMVESVITGFMCCVVVVIFLGQVNMVKLMGSL